MSGRPLGFNRGHDSIGSADFLCRKTRGILLGGLKNSTKTLVELGAADLFDVKHVLGERSGDPFGDRIVDL